MMIGKFYTLVLCLFLFSYSVNAQSWPQGSGARSSFDGFGIDYNDYANDDYSDNSATGNSRSSIFGDNAFISTMAESDSGWGGSPSDPVQTVPITESILGLLGLGGAYAWKLIRGKKNKGKQEQE